MARTQHPVVDSHVLVVPGVTSSDLSNTEQPSVGIILENDNEVGPMAFGILGKSHKLMNPIQIIWQCGAIIDCK